MPFYHTAALLLNPFHEDFDPWKPGRAAPVSLLAVVDFTQVQRCFLKAAAIAHTTVLAPLFHFKR
jgi:hypothetical protein